jgi:hypothetical protein
MLYFCCIGFAQDLKDSMHNLLPTMKEESNVDVKVGAQTLGITNFVGANNLRNACAFFKPHLLISSCLFGQAGCSWPPHWSSLPITLLRVLSFYGISRNIETLKRS